MISVAIIEDIKDIRNSLREYLQAQPTIYCKICVESVEEFLSYSSEDISIDIVLLDIGLPGMSGLTGMKFIKEKYPAADILMLTVYDDQNKIFNALCAGASGYLLKNTPLPKIVEAIEELHNGGAPMSPQIARKVINHFTPQKNNQPPSLLTLKEREIVAGLVDGLSYKMIAAANSISIETVRFHIKNIYKKLHVNCKAEVISKSFRGEI